MSDFEDPDLQDRLRRLGGHRGDDDFAYIQLQQLVRIAKRRRAATVVGGVGAAWLIGIGSMVLTNRNEDRLTPADGGVDSSEVKTVPTDVSSTDVEDSTTLPTSPTSPTSTIATAPESTAPATVAPETTVPPTTAPANDAGGPPSIPPNAPSSSSGGAPPNIPPSSGKPTHKPPTSKPPTSTAPSTTAPSNSTPSNSTPSNTTPSNTMASTGPSPAGEGPAIYSSTGGTVTVEVKNGRLTLVDRQANDGYHAEVEVDEGNVVRVRFESDGRTTRIEVRYEGGTLTAAIDNNIGHGERSGSGSGHGDGDGGHDGGPGSDAGWGSDDSVVGGVGGGDN